MSYNWPAHGENFTPQKSITKVVNTAYKSFDAQRKAEK